MSDHIQRIRKQLLTEAEDRAIEEMEVHATPIFYALGVALTLIAVSTAADAYAAHKYAGQVHTASIFAQCLSGASIDTGEGLVTCPVVFYPLVKGLK